jgi:hypothetical protein
MINEWKNFILNLLCSMPKSRISISYTNLFLRFLLIASPWILLFVTTSLIAQQSVFKSVPCWSDELSYWHEVFSFSQKGFNFGYYTVNELIPKFLSFGPHGFGTITVYSLFAKIFGWNSYSIVLANCSFITFAFIVLLLVAKPSIKKLILILLFTISYVPLILFTSTSMSELLNFAILIIYFSLFFAYFKGQNYRLFALLIVCCCIFSCIRINYVVLFLPLIFLKNKTLKVQSRFSVYLILWLIGSLLFFIFNGLFVSPFPDSYLNELYSIRGLREIIFNFSTHYFQNTVNFLNPFSDNLIQVSERYFVIFVMLYTLTKSDIIQSKFKSIEIEYFIVFLILFLSLILNLAVYDIFDWRDYRVLSPILFGSVIFLILTDKRFFVFCSMSINMLTIILLLFSPQVSVAFNTNRYDQIAENKLIESIKYIDNPKSQFENTLVVKQFDASIVLNVPAGIGISRADVLSDKLKSKYLYSIKRMDLSTYKLINYDSSGYLYQKK